MNKRNIWIVSILVIAAIGITLHNAPPDSSTEILSGTYTYPMPAVSDVDKWWNRTHYLAETMHRSDGAWGGGYAELSIPGYKCNSTHPLVRQTAHAVMGYSYAYSVYGNWTYRQRAIDGLQWLLDEQIKTGTNAGAFRWYCSDSIIEASTYETGLAGKSLVYGYREFNDSRYLDAARLAAVWESRQNPSWNHNTNAFMISHLSEYYRTTREDFALNRAIYLSRTMLANQTPEGYFGDIYNHNEIAYYHEIITRSLIELLTVMPANHPDRSNVTKGTYKAINYIITHQNPDGSMWLTPTDSTPNEEEYVMDGLGLAYKELNLPVLNVLKGLTNYYMSRQDIGKDAAGIPPGVSWKEPFEQKPVIVGYMVDFVYAHPNS